MKKGVFFIFILMCQTSGLFAADQYWSEQGQVINGLIQLAHEQYQKGDKKQARRTTIKAYFTEFEDRKVEAAMRMELGAKYTYLVEKRFGTIRKMIGKGASFEEVEKLSLELQEARWLSITPLEWMPQIEWLGIFPTLETSLTQLVFLLPLPLAWYWIMQQRTVEESGV